MGDKTRPPLGLDCAIVFGLVYAASLHAARSGEAAKGEYGRMEPFQGLMTPKLDAITALRQWIYSRAEEAPNG